MARYITGLKASIDVPDIRVELVEERLLKVIRDAGFSTGTRRTDPPTLGRLKRQRGVIDLYLEGFVAHAGTVWRAVSDDATDALEQIDPAFA